ncbi:MAG: hypothetical protein MJD61_00335, partial [Proteobacteria bacterium]|nr:hypothetical protein [Pseudomonadota bacterium]
LVPVQNGARAAFVLRPKLEIALLFLRSAPAGALALASILDGNFGSKPAIAAFDLETARLFGGYK